MGSGSIYGVMVITMRGSGSTVWGMGRGVMCFRSGMSMWVNMCSVKPMDMGSTDGKMTIFTADSFSMGSRVDKDHGKRVGKKMTISIQASTKMTWSMATENSSGPLEASIEATMKKTRRQATVRCSGLTVASTEGIGKMALKTASASWSLRMACVKQASSLGMFTKLHYSILRA
jgi:hypothetical protein